MVSFIKFVKFIKLTGRLFYAVIRLALGVTSRRSN